MMKSRYIIPAIVLVSFLFSCKKTGHYKTIKLYTPICTFKQEVADNATLQGAQAIQKPGSFALYGNLMLMNEKDKGIHVIDVSDGMHPLKKGFVPIPRNQGLAVRNNYMYADCGGEIFVFSITLQGQVELKKVLHNAFPMRTNYSDTDIYDTKWETRDTTVEENSTYWNSEFMMYDKAATANANPVPTSANTGGGISMGSSMSVFAIVGDYLYTVDKERLYTFSLSDAINPELKNTVDISPQGGFVETIYPFKDKLFIGSTNGTFMYELKDPSAPSFLSNFTHVRRCDPVIADDHYAYVTLRSGAMCGGFTNQMDVLDISDIRNPKLVRTYTDFLQPRGLSKDGNMLLVCDGQNGIRVMDAANASNIVVKETVRTGEAIDVIAINGRAYVMMSNGVQIFSYSSTISIQPLGFLANN